MSTDLTKIARQLLTGYLYDGPSYEAVYESDHAEELSEGDMEAVHDLILADLRRIREQYIGEGEL